MKELKHPPPLKVDADYSGVVGSFNPAQFSKLLVRLFEGIATSPSPSQSAEQATWELARVGKWKIDRSSIVHGHIPLRINFPIIDLEMVIAERLPVDVTYTITGEKHWRIMTFSERGKTLGRVHFANRD